MYSHAVQPTPPAGTDVGRCWKFATDHDRPTSTPGLRLQNRGPRVRILAPLPIRIRNAPSKPFGPKQQVAHKHVGARERIARARRGAGLGLDAMDFVRAMVWLVREDAHAVFSGRGRS